MRFVETTKERICESNKKISFSQKSSVETKSAKEERKFDSMGQSFFVYDNEVIESALFDRVTRDCSGSLVRTVPVRRFRKIGSDEWFSLLARVGNDVWINNFETASHEEAMKQGEKNINEMGSEDKQYYAPDSVSTATSFSVVNPIGDEQKKKRKNLIKLAIVGVTLFAIYKYYNKK